jgi:hypothetical protein
MNWESFVAGALCGIVIIVALLAFTDTRQTTTASGTINTSLTFHPSHIDWGNVYVGTPTTRNVTFTNQGEAWQSLNMTYGNATENLLNYTVTWDGEGLPLPSSNSLVANFTLTIIEANITVTDQFSIDIWIGDQT